MSGLIPTMKLPLDGLPPEKRRNLSGQRVAVRIRPGLRAALRSHRRIPVSEWSQKRRVMGSEESFEGKWNPEFAPHAVKVMDMWAQPWVRELWFCGPDQASKTNSMLSCLGWSIEIDPDNVYYTGPTEEKTRELITGKLIPMLHNSPALRRFVSRYDDDTTGKQVKLINGVTIRGAWAGSASSTSAFSARYTYNDEIDKWDTSGKEASAIQRIKKRAKNFPFNHKHFFASTPGGRYIYKGTMSCQQVFEYAARCPDCGDLVVMDEEHLVIPAGATVDSVKEHPEQVGYACNCCGSVWDEDKRLVAFRTGDWLCIKGAHILKPVDIGVHMTGFVTPDMPMASIACTIIKAKEGDLDSQIDLAHGIKCVDYQPGEKAARKEDAILALRDDRIEGMVPSVPIAAITAIADMQKRGFWYTIRAHAYGLEGESWLLKCGFVDSWAGLEGIFFRSQFKDINGNTYVPNLWAMDSGGGESEEGELTKTAEAYLFGCRHPEVLLLKGNSRMSSMFRREVLDKFPGTNKPLPGTATLYNVNSNRYKNELAAKLQINPSDPGAWHLHSGLTEADVAVGMTGDEIGQERMRSFARQMCAEVLIDGKWDNPKRLPNHFWDCSYYEMALLNIAGVRHWARPEDQPQQRQKPEHKTTKRRRW